MVAVDGVDPSPPLDHERVDDATGGVGGAKDDGVVLDFFMKAAVAAMDPLLPGGG